MPINEIVGSLSVALDTLPVKIIVAGLVLLAAGYYVIAFTTEVVEQAKKQQWKGVVFFSGAATLIAGLVVHTYYPA